MIQRHVIYGLSEEHARQIARDLRALLMNADGPEAERLWKFQIGLERLTDREK